MGALYAKDGQIYANEPLELYIPMDYFNSGMAENAGISVETFGILFIKTFGSKESDYKLFNIPSIINVMIHEFKYETITIHGDTMDVMTLEYAKDTVIMKQTLVRGRVISEFFLTNILKGKIPSCIAYSKLIDIWWKNLEIAGVSYKSPSKIFEFIISAIYRNPNNLKERFGQLYGKQANPNEYNYAAKNVREVVKNLSTFSGMVFEDIGAMISSGISNSINEVEEPESPLEKIIHY